MDLVLLQYNLGGRKFKKCSIDFIIVTSVMKDRCLREKFACLSLPENIKKKIV